MALGMKKFFLRMIMNLATMQKWFKIFFRRTYQPNAMTNKQSRFQSMNFKMVYDKAPFLKDALWIHNQDIWNQIDG